MRKKVLWISMLAVAMLCACTTKENSGKPIMTPTPIVTVTAAPTGTPAPTITKSPASVLEEKAEEYLATLEVIDWTEMNYHADEATSLKNSNMLNYGYLTYDDNGNIYYSDERDGGIYVSDYKGENKRLLSEDSGSWLQVKDDWLYYNSDVCGIDRINVTTCEREHLYDDVCGEFSIVDDGLLINSQGSVLLLNVEKGEKEIVIHPEKIGFSQMAAGVYDNSFLCNAYLSYTLVGNADLLWKGYLVTLDGEELKLINKRGYFPLVAGSYLSIVDAETRKRQVLDLETKKITNLKARTDQTAVSDGQVVYYKEIMHGDAYREEGEEFPTKLNTFIFKWDGEETELLWRIDTDNLYYMFLTPKALYCLPQINIDGKYGYHLLYYDLETGETGQIY